MEEILRECSLKWWIWKQTNLDEMWVFFFCFFTSLSFWEHLFYSPVPQVHTMYLLNRENQNGFIGQVGLHIRGNLL